MGTAHKKVVVRLLEGGLVWGYLPGGGFVRDELVEMMAVDGKSKTIVLNEIKAISYVRDFNLEDAVDPERMGKRAFVGRPRGDGLWVRLEFADGDLLEGLMGVDLGFVAGVMEDRGVFLTPPDTKANAQRVFVPVSSMRSLEVLGYVTAPSKRAASKRAMEGQGGLFEE